MSNLLVVGIAASAGGLQPMIDLFNEASCHRSMCFVVVSHLARFAKTDLPQILGKISNLQSGEIEPGSSLEACRLYTIRPNTYVQVKEGQFQVSARPQEPTNQCADVFFESLAQAYGENAIGVVLSGARAGTDGSRGVLAIKRMGGHTYAQDPETALFKDMPLSAIATGAVDSVLPPRIIGHELSLLSWVAQGLSGNASPIS